MFRSMLTTRIVELEIAKEYPKQEMRTPVHLCIGQEAPPAGISASLQNSDLVVSGHRSHGHYISKGGNISSMIAEIYGKETGCSKGLGGSQHLVDTSVGFMGSAPILGSTISIGTGLALGLKMLKKTNVVIAYFGDSATEEGIFHESLNFASIHQLPIVFACENNLYSTHTSLAKRQPKRNISELGKAHLVPGFTVDGNDVRKVFEISKTAIHRARRGDGPSLIEFMTYRWLEHVGPNSDEDLGYRTKSEIEEWKKNDPIEIESNKLALEIPDWANQRLKIENEIRLEVNKSFEFAKNSPFPTPLNLESGIYPEKVISYV
jgi:TPP-dependent pyruvate/acetoin dehydrogenase alpha subunit